MSKTTGVVRKSSRPFFMVVGDSYCSKTLLVHFDQDESTYKNVLNSLQVRVVEITEKQEHKVQQVVLLDVDGRQSHLVFRKELCYKRADIILICFSIGDPESLKNVSEKWIPEVKTYCPNVPIMLVGNKKDVRCDTKVIDELKKVNKEPVTQEEGSAMAKQINAFAYIECSAKTFEGVDDIYKAAASVILEDLTTEQTIEKSHKSIFENVKTFFSFLSK